MDTPLLESFVYLLIRPGKGGLRVDDNRKQYVMAGAVIMELSLLGRLELENKRIKLKNPKLTGNPILDEALQLMKKAGKPKKVKDWVYKLGMRSRKSYARVLKDMSRKGKVILKQKRFLFFKWKRPYLADPRRQEELKAELREVVFKGRKPEQNTVMLLGLLYASRCYTILCKEKCEAKEVKKAIKAILEKYPLAEGVDKAIQEMLDAIAVTLMSSTIATTAVVTST